MPFVRATAKLSPHLDRLNTLSENRVEMKSKAHNNFSHTYSRYLGDSWLDPTSQRGKIDENILLGTLPTTSDSHKNTQNTLRLTEVCIRTDREEFYQLYC